MSKAMLQLFAEYNEKANRDMNGLLSKLTNDQWVHEFGGYYKSVRSVANHIYIADFNWLKRFGSLKKFHFLDDPLFESSLPSSSVAFETIDEYLGKRNRLDHKFLDFVNELKEEDMEKTFTFKSYKGTDQTKKFGGTVLHVFNHQTHHRGMISIYLDSLGVENDYSNLLNVV